MTYSRTSDIGTEFEQAKKGDVTRAALDAASFGVGTVGGVVGEIASIPFVTSSTMLGQGDAEKQFRDHFGIALHGAMASSPAIRKAAEEIDARVAHNAMIEIASAGGVAASTALLPAGGPMIWIATRAAGAGAGYAYDAFMGKTPENAIDVTTAAMRLQQSGRNVPPEMVASILIANISRDDLDNPDDKKKLMDRFEEAQKAAKKGDAQALDKFIKDPLVENALRNMTELLPDKNDADKSVVQQVTDLVNSRRSEGVAKILKIQDVLLNKPGDFRVAQLQMDIAKDDGSLLAATNGVFAPTPQGVNPAPRFPVEHVDDTTSKRPNVQEDKTLADAGLPQPNKNTLGLS